MNLINFNENQLPLAELETIGLAAGGQLLLHVEDMKALMSGRRTALVHLENLEAENIKIKAIDAKLSLRRRADGKADLLIHPVYRKAVVPDFLDVTEARELERGELGSLLKVITDKKGTKREVLVEFDRETKEFIVSDTELILAPDMVNGEFLSAAQQLNYRKGNEVELADGTIFNYSATDPHGIRSNKIALVASILVDGGLSYLLFKGLNALFNTRHEPRIANALSPGYFNARNDMENSGPAVPNSNENIPSKSRMHR